MSFLILFRVKFCESAFSLGDIMSLNSWIVLQQEFRWSGIRFNLSQSQGQLSRRAGPRRIASRARPAPVEKTLRNLATSAARFAVVSLLQPLTTLLLPRGQRGWAKISRARESNARLRMYAFRVYVYIYRLWACQKRYRYIRGTFQWDIAL